MFAEEVILNDAELGSSAARGLSKSGHYDIRHGIGRPAQLLASPGRHKSSTDTNAQYQVSVEHVFVAVFSQQTSKELLTHACVSESHV